MTEDEARDAARSLLEDANVDGDLVVLDTAEVYGDTGDGETMVMVALVVPIEHLKEWLC